VGSIDAMLHVMRRRCDGSRVRAHRWRHCSAYVVTSGRLSSRPAWRKEVHKAFPFLEFLFHLNFQGDEKNKIEINN
jgi:hypothetical protein